MNKSKSHPDRWLFFHRFTPQYMKDIYNDQTYLSHNPTWGEEDAPMKADAIARLLSKNKITFRSVAEVGCGSGEILVQLEKKFPGAEKFYGFDISKDALQIAAKKESDKIHFEFFDLAEHNKPGIPFDILLVIDVLEHLPDYFSFLNGIHAKSTYTVFHIPLDMSVWSLFREKMLIESKKRVGHIHAFTEEFILDMLREKGFEVIDKIYTPPTFTHHSARQKIADVIRKMIFALNKKLASKTIGGYSIMVLTKNAGR
jgi:predicted TPR repeat methyltransferase